MYQEHFDFETNPFALTPDTQFYCELPSHAEALNVLLIALKSNEGFIKITGDVGSGKTLLCRKLLNELESPFLTTYLPNPHLTTQDLYQTLADELNIPHAQNTAPHKLHKKINDFLITAAQKGQKPVLIIDEAQAMPLDTLESLRLLTNLETEKQKLLQIVLFGQPELDQVLQKPNLRQLRQRITFSYSLKTLTFKQSQYYIRHRLAIAGTRHRAIFSQLAWRAIFFYSRGYPRLINILAHKALLSAYGKGEYIIGLLDVHHAARDTDDCRNRFKLLQVNVYWMILALTVLLFLGIRS